MKTLSTHYKILLIGAMIICFTQASYAQDKYAEKEVAVPKMYVSLGTGINYNTGIIGVQFEGKLNNNFSAYGGAGMGTWGNKITLGMRYYYGPSTTSAISFSYSYVTGASGVKSQLEIIDSTASGYQSKKDVTFDANPVSTVNLSWLKYWRMGKKSRFNIELGYSVALNSNYESNYSVKDPVKLTDVSKAAIKIIQPGGLIIGIGFSFGL